MKYQTTNKALKSAPNLITVGYCELQHTLAYFRPRAYVTSKIYGWRCDVYEFGDFTIVTGYATPSHGLELPHDTARALETDCRFRGAEYCLETLKREVNAFLTKGETKLN